MKLKFQAKVLIPVVTVMILFLIVTMWLVGSRITQQLQGETKALLSTADNEVTNALQTHSENLIRQFGPIPAQSGFFSVALLFQKSSEDKKVGATTMNGLLGDILDIQSRETAALFFASPSGQLLAGTNRFSGIEQSNLYAACLPLIRNAAENQKPAVYPVQVGKTLFDAVVIPSTLQRTGDLLGVLAVLVVLDANVAEQVKGPNSQIAFIANDGLVASTLGKGEFDPALIAAYKSLAQPTLSPGDTDAAEIILGNEHYGARAGHFPQASPQENAGYLLLVSYEKSLQALRDQQRFLLLCSLLGVALGSLIVWAVVKRVTRPLRQLRDSAEAVGRGDFSRKIEINSDDELGELARVFNHMTENLQKSLAQLEKTVEILRTTQAQLVHSEKLSAVGEFVAGVAHELNNPLTALIGYSELLQTSKVDESAKTSLKRISNSAERCHKIVQSLLSFARQRPPEQKLTDVNQLVDSVIDILIYELRTSNIQIIKELAPKLPRLLVDPHQIQQVFLNIVNNARQAVEAFRPHGSIRIATGAIGQKVWVRFQDDGPGISEENLARIFNPFFTTKPVGKGTGLGLSLSYGIIQEHGGTITAESKPGHGTTFIIELPVTADAEVHVAPASETAPKPPPSGEGKSVLVVDDEEDILHLVREILQRQGYKAQTASDGQVALDHLAKEKFDLIISDWKMPGVNGQQLYQRLLEINPAAAQRMIFMTGDVLSDKTEKYLKEQGKLCLTKPFSLVEFQRAVGELFE